MLNAEMVRPRGAQPIRLSERELEVLELMGFGFTSQEAANQLCVSKRTVDFHLSNVYDKLGVKNRMQALRLASRAGFLPFEPRA